MRSLGEFWRNMRTWQRITLGAGGVILFLFVFFVFSFEAVHYTESTEFCSTCHAVMEPQIVAHAVSAHANVDCGECHIGPGIKSKLYYKAMAVRYLWTLPLKLFKRPIPTARATMRTTKEICEQCHSTDNFESTILRTNYEYGTDENNTFSRVLLALKVGNGIDKVPGTGVGADWHVQHPVRFVATDDSFQEIPWVQAEKDGKTVTYIASGSDPELYANAESEMRTMDCIDCHSRSGHPVNKPADVVDDAMANNRIPADLPYVKAQTMAVLDQRYASREEALATIDTNLRSYYQTKYPDVYAARQADVDRTITETQKIFAQTSFPYMNVYWDTYPNNTGHINSPGCWRCHDGNHLSDQGTAIPPACNLCHGLPQEAREGEVLPVLSFGDGKLPESHQSSLWISEHRFRFDATCDDCHTVSNPGGTTNTSFCSNSGCHARDWNYLQIDTPAVLALSVPTEQPSTRRIPNIPHPIVEDMVCDTCHGPGKVLAYPDDHADYSQEECTDCHRLAPDVRAELVSEGAAPAVEARPLITPTAVPSITHTLLGNENCLACHAVNSTIAPAPVSHQGLANESCQGCHQLAPEFASESAATPTPEASATPLSTPTATVPTATVTVSATLVATTAPAATVTVSATATVEASPTETPTLATAAVATVTAAGSPTVAATTAITPTQATPAVATVTVAATPTAAEPTATPVATVASEVITPSVTNTAAAPVAASQALTIPHALQGNENCLACHAVTSPISPAPPNHAGFTVDQCQECHRFSAEAVATPTKAP